MESHARNMATDEALYEYQKDGEFKDWISLKAALKREKWDFVTVQQCSPLSGLPVTYEPYLTQLLSFVREHTPAARVVFHQTWAYETTAVHKEFVRYGCSSETMFCAICRASEAAAAAHGLSLLRTGEAIQALRRLPEFDPEQGGLALTRDGYHLSTDYECYAAGLWWGHFFTGRPFSALSTVSAGMNPLITRIKETLSALPQAALTA